MTLTTHAIVGGAAGAAVAAATSNPWGLLGGFIAGFASHLIIDAIPHWNEGVVMLRSLRNPLDKLKRDLEMGRDFAYDVVYLGGESLLGLLVAWGWFSFGFFHFSPWAILLGTVGGLLPDALHLVYFKTRAWGVTQFEEFHSGLQHESTNIWYLGTEAWTILIALALLKLFA